MNTQAILSLDKSFNSDAVLMALDYFDNNQISDNLRADRIALVDFTKHRNEMRFWIIDLSFPKILLKTYVAHGSGSGGNYPHHFSNTPGSNMSSLGAMRTSDVYQGKHGRSMRLNGLETGLNDNVRSRSIVIHAADYISSMLAMNGSNGNSQGCFAVSNSVKDTVINLLLNKTLLFAFHPDLLKVTVHE